MAQSISLRKWLVSSKPHTVLPVSISTPYGVRRRRLFSVTALAVGLVHETSWQ